MKLDKILTSINTQDENKIDTSKGMQTSGIAYSVIEVLKAVKETNRDKITLTSKMLEVEFLSKQSIYNALKSLGIANTNEGKKTSYPCKFFVKEGSLKPSSEVLEVNIWDIQNIV